MTKKVKKEGGIPTNIILKAHHKLVEDGFRDNSDTWKVAIKTIRGATDLVESLGGKIEWKQEHER